MQLIVGTDSINMNTYMIHILISFKAPFRVKALLESGTNRALTKRTHGVLRVTRGYRTITTQAAFVLPEEAAKELQTDPPSLRFEDTNRKSAKNSTKRSSISYGGRWKKRPRCSCQIWIDGSTGHEDAWRSTQRRLLQDIKISLYASHTNDRERDLYALQNRRRRQCVTVFIQDYQEEQRSSRIVRDNVDELMHWCGKHSTSGMRSPLHSRIECHEIKKANRIWLPEDDAKKTLEMVVPSECSSAEMKPQKAILGE